MNIIKINNMLSIIDYLPSDLVFSLTSLQFDRRHFIMFNTCCRTLLSKYNMDSREIWTKIDTHSDDIQKIINAGYRNFRINNLEFFVVNARAGIRVLGHDDARVYCLHTTYGSVLTIYGDIINMGIDTVNINQIEYLKEAYPYNAVSRPLYIGPILR